MAPGTASTAPLFHQCMYQLFFIGFAYILHEEFFKGTGMFPLHPSDE